MIHAGRWVAPRAARPLFTAAACVLVLAPASAPAQTEGAPEPGARVRLTLPCPPSGEFPRTGICIVQGSLVRLTPDTVTVTSGGRTAGHELAGLQRFQVRSGTKSYWLAGAAVGFMVGGGLTYVALSGGGSTGPCNRSANQDALGTEECLALTAAGALATAGLGALIGWRVRSEQWDDVPLGGARIGLAAAGQGRGIAITVALPWPRRARAPGDGVRFLR